MPQDAHQEVREGVSAIVQRHKTAIRRLDLSKPMRIGIEAGLLHPGTTVFDYGCGRGDDLRTLELRGIPCSGWDPRHRPDVDRRPADVVNLGYVVNVIERAEERAQVLRDAWSLARTLLIVSARLETEIRSVKATEFSDGYLTRRGTFQKFYTQGELGQWIDDTLKVMSIAAAPGVFFIFRDAAARLSFLASQYRRVAPVPRPKASDALFAQHKAALEPLMSFFANRGRLPAEGELANAEKVHKLFSSIPRAFAVVRRATGADKWDQVAAERKQDLLVYLALARFGGRARFSELPVDLQNDVKAFCGSYNRACHEADILLLASGNMDSLNTACQAALFGKLLPDALYVHMSWSSLKWRTGCRELHLPGRPSPEQ